MHRLFGTNVQVETYLEQGKKFLATGQLADALSQYHAAIGMRAMTCSLINILLHTTLLNQSALLLVN